MKNFNFSLVSDRHLSKYLNTQEFFLWTFYGFFLAIIVLTLSTWFINRDHSHLIYVTYLVTVMIGLTAIGNNANAITNFLSYSTSSHILLGIHIFLIVPIIIFSIFYFDPRKLSKRTSEIMIASGLFASTTVVWSLSLPYYSSVIYALTIITLIFCITSSYTAIKLGVAGSKHAWVYFFGWVIVYYLLIKFCFVILFNLDTNLPTFYNEMRLALAVESVFIAIALSLRIKEMSRIDQRVHKRVRSVQSKIESEITRRLDLRDELLKAEDNRQRYLRQEVDNRTRELDIIVQELSDANKDLDRLRLTDPLTQLGNRIYLYEGGRTEIDYQAQKDKETMGVLMIDIDHFKSVNDNYGHESGDTVLKTVAQTIANIIDKRHRVIARYGGEEFVALIPKTNHDEILLLAEAIRTTIEQKTINTSDASIKVTISIGVHIFTPCEGQTLDVCIGPADKALYVAKKDGRNKVVSSSGLSS